MANISETVKQYIFPSSIEEAIEVLKSYKEVKIVAGGTSLVYAGIRKQPAVLVDITHLPLNYIKNDGNYLKIGATTLVRDLCRNELTCSFASGIMAKACNKIGDQQIQNLVTVGGNIVKPFSWSDLPVVMLVLDAEFTIVGDEKRTIPAVEYYQGCIKRTEILTEILLPLKNVNALGNFEKFTRTQIDYAIINLAVSGHPKEQNICTDLRIAVSALTKKPQRLFEAEKCLDGTPLSEELINKVVSETSANLLISPSYKASKKYLKHIFSVKLRDILTKRIWRVVG